MALKRLNIGRHMDRLDGWQGEEPMPFAPRRKFGDRPGIGLACVWVANVGGEERDEPFGRMRRRRKEHRELSLCKLSGVYLCIVFGAHATTPGS